jgi:hypothetical protein
MIIRRWVAVLFKAAFSAVSSGNFVHIIMAFTAQEVGRFPIGVSAKKIGD